MYAALGVLVSAAALGQVCPGPLEEIGEALAAARTPKLYNYAALLSAANLSDLEENRLVVGFRYYPDGVVNDEEPIRLQPFAQRSSHFQGGFQDGPDEVGVALFEGRYLVPHSAVCATARMGFGELSGTTDLFFFSPGAVVYIGREDLAIEAELELGTVDNGSKTDYSVLTLACHFVLEVGEGTLEMLAGVRSYDDDAPGARQDSGLVLRARYFFNRELSVSLSFATDESDRFAGTIGYANDTGIEVELEAGRDKSAMLEGARGDYLSLQMGFRF